MYTTTGTPVDIWTYFETMETRQKVKNNSAKITPRTQTPTNDLPVGSNGDQQGVKSFPSSSIMNSSPGAQSCTTERMDIKEDNESPFGSDLQRRIEDALQSKEVISTIVKAVSEAILENVKNEVYKAIDFDIQEKTGKIAELDLQLSTIKGQISSLRDVMEEQEQYSRRNCLRFQGIKESTNEVTDDAIIKLVREKLHIDIQPSDIDRSHRIPLRARDKPVKRMTNVDAKEAEETQAKPIIVKFARYNVRSAVYKARSKLKGSNVYIHEDLTRMRSELVYEARKHEQIKRVWTNDGRVTALTKDDTKVKLRKISDLDRL